MLIRLLSSKVRVELLSALYAFPEKELYLRELVRITGEDHKNISLELNNLETIGLVSSRRDGNRKYFHINQSFFLCPELKSIFLKTTGAVGLLRDALSGLKGITVAFLFGSFAAGAENAKSDIDFMVIGNISQDTILKRIRETEKRLGREINPAVYDAAEIRTRIKQKDSFVAQVLDGPKVMLVGTEDDLRRIAEQRCAKKSKVSPSQVRERLGLAKRDIKAAKIMMASDWDWAFSMAYNSVLQATKALMLSKGCRPAGGEGQHKVAVMFAEMSMGEKLQDDIYIFDKMRSKRHRVIYDVSGLISQQEARQAFDFAVRYVKSIEKLLKKIFHEK